MGFIVFRHPFAKGIRQRCWWVGNGSFDIGGVFGQHHEVQINHFLTRKAVEISINESAGNFARAVSARGQRGSS
ncbi:hypothetical protein LTSEWAN_5446 [Salmonella enterica subsp. enterica serovar Wandsworth str. A4-580]|uniref:Uncharacterized protein n=1 Tax=Salmonella enterica subsp. enterica serovar Wandsworth str. A4-580 TaxID=913086 RepID=G5SID6_SALET|nr:hypothetical protein LTSEWAN_5446 [Salmonella enterica subsp. enterica serovar Wandsworth str. A4-580]